MLCKAEIEGGGAIGAVLNEGYRSEDGSCGKRAINDNFFVCFCFLFRSSFTEW